jgi:hypothetical protein
MRLALASSLLAAATAAAPAAAQIGIEARVGAALDSLSFADAESEDRASAAGFLELEYGFAQRRGRVFYSLDAASYATPGDWTTLLHEVGGVYRIDLSGSETARLFLATSANWRDNGDAWAAAGHRGLSGRANLELRPGAGAATLRLGYRIDRREFSDLEELDQLEQDGFASALVNLETRTTLVAEIHVGGKSYDGVPAAAATPASPLPPIGRSRGRGGMGPSRRSEPLLVTAPGERAGRVAWLVRVAQSLAERTGVSLQYAARHSFGDVPPLLITTPAHFLDDGVYDDPYASDARGGRAVFTHELASWGTTRAWGAWEGKDYAATPALDPDGEPTPALREDRLWRAGAGWRAPLFPRSTGDVVLDLDVTYAFTRHRSNDAFYDYSSHAAGVSLRLAY